MRTAFAHDAVLDMGPDADLTAPGGSVTLALCGAFDHPPPCPVAPHHTRAERRTDGVAVRVLFATDAAREAEVRAKIDQALARIENGSYGFCEETDEPIGLRRLEARPIATLSIEAQERHERMERVHRDD